MASSTQRRRGRRTVRASPSSAANPAPTRVAPRATPRWSCSRWPPTAATSNGVHDEGPAWAPNGNGALVFTRDDGTNSDLWIRTADGGERRLTDQPSLEESPDWQAVPPPGGPQNVVIVEPPRPPAPTLVTPRVRVSRTGRLAIRM